MRSPFFFIVSCWDLVLCTVHWCVLFNIFKNCQPVRTVDYFSKQWQRIDITRKGDLIILA